MQIDVKFKDEENDTVVEGKFNPTEISFLLQYAVNHLMAMGVRFAKGEDESVTLKWPVKPEAMN